jgi:hypothetical protein
MDRAIHILRALFSEVLSNYGRDAPTLTWHRRPMAAHDRDAPPRLRAWWLRRLLRSSRSAIARWASLDFASPARVRGDRLLAENLPQAQLEQFKDRGYFLVTGGDTGKRYRIRRGYQMNVEQLDGNGKLSHVLCFMPEGHLAEGDVVLAQKLALELFESEALKIANRIPPHFSRFHDSAL